MASVDTKTVTNIHVLPDGCHIDPGTVIVTEGIYEEIITTLGLHGGGMSLSESNVDDQEVLLLSAMPSRSGRHVNSKCSIDLGSATFYV